jgi:CRISPR type III-A-associated protein Csm2
MDITFWEKKDEKVINRELFRGVAQKIAENMPLKTPRSNGKGFDHVNKPSQIRGFYDDVLRYETLLKNYATQKERTEAFPRYLPHILMLAAKVKYALARKKVSQEFSDFISSSIAQIETYEDFMAFKHLFEAFLGYYKLSFAQKGGKDQ